MNFTTFAEKYHLRVRRDPCGDLFIPGRFGSISEYDSDFLALSFLADSDNKSRDNVLRSRIRRALAAGFEPSQVSDLEAIVLFDGNDKVQIGAAIKLADIKRRRRATGRPFTSSRAKEIGKATQFRPSRRVEGPQEAKSRGISPQVEEMPDPVIVGAFRPSD